MTVIPLRKLQTANEVLAEAATKKLKHVIILGITEDGANYFEANRTATLQDLVWLVFCGDDSVTRMVNQP